MTGIPASWARLSTGSASFTSIGTRPVTSTFLATRSSRSFTYCAGSRWGGPVLEARTEILASLLHAVLQSIEPGDAGILTTVTIFF